VSGVLVVSPDEEAAGTLCAALQRSGRAARWELDLGSGRETARDSPPLVLVADAGMPGVGALVAEVRDAGPWTRVYLMGDPSIVSATSTPVLSKPFDAAEVAGLLLRELELADLDRARHGLEARADELALLVEASFEAIVGLAPDGTIRSWNPGAVSIYGWKPEEIVGRSVEELEADSAALRTRLSTSDRSAAEVRRRTKDGREILVLLSLSPITGQSGGTLGFAEVSLDVTERRKLERALQHGERLAAIGRLAASMAHEINNPLAVIRAAAARVGVMAARLEHPDLAEAVADLDLASERIASFVQHVGGFARRDRAVLSDAPLGATIDMSVRLVRPRAASRGVTLELQPSTGPRVMQDPPRLAQALVNVLANAIDAAAAGGRTVHLRFEEAPERVRIEVDDDGPGVAPEMTGKLFEPFATTKPPGEGTGLGLSITRQILEDHRGAIEIVPREGGGTRVILTLPKQDLRRFLVLVVDRDPAVRRALATDVGRAGFRVRSAGSLAQARELLSAEEVSVVLTDLVLPDGSARDLLAELRAKRPEIGRFVVTTDREGAAAAGEPVFEKPWDTEKLLLAIRGACVRLDNRSQPQ
jgi:PAS domain S-box-containing protein